MELVRPMKPGKQGKLKVRQVEDKAGHKRRATKATFRECARETKRDY